ncbi:MAG: ABC transporter permease [Lachnospiraceae bacterium]|nr:ABC transporter permease [Lachnospiraceae bacterium]
MGISVVWYSLKQGIRNIWKNVWFSLASVATISACVFLFCLFFSIIANIHAVVKNMESTVGITVLFEEGLTEADILALGAAIGGRNEVKEMVYVSAKEAWETFRQDYFAGHEELAEGFAEDNPLAGSASYEIYLYHIDDQDVMVAYLEALDGVRQVNYSHAVMAGFAGFNRVASLLSLAVIGVLLAVAMFLISNTISVAAAFRKQESQIMRLIGATNFMIRAPFIVEGVLIGMVGAGIPLAGMYALYTWVVEYLASRFSLLPGIFSFMPIEEIYPVMVAVAVALGVGIGFFGSFFTIRKYLKV